MFVEYCAYNYGYHVDYKEIIKLIKYFEFHGVAVPVYAVKDLRQQLNSDTIISIPIDYPLGLSSIESKLQEICAAKEVGADAVDYMPNPYLLSTDPNFLQHEIKRVIQMCAHHRLLVRAFLDCNRFQSCTYLAKMLWKHGVRAFYPVVGYHNTDLSDTIIDARMLSTQVGGDIIFNGYIWRPDQLELVRRAGFFGVRIYDTRCFIGQDQH